MAAGAERRGVEIALLTLWEVGGGGSKALRLGR